MTIFLNKYNIKIDSPIETLWIGVIEMIVVVLFIIVYSLFLWVIFKLITLIRREKLELSKKILLISAGIGAGGGF